MAITSTSTFNIGGLMSGIDTEALIKAYVDLKETRLLDPLENRVLEVKSKQTASAKVKTLLTSLKSAADALKQVGVFDGKTSSSSDTAKMTISSTTSTASPGTSTVLISALAQADKEYFNGVADRNLTQWGTGTITITSEGTTSTVAITSTNNTLEGIRDAINATSGIPVTASIINDGTASPHRLVLTSNTTGSTAGITQDIASVLTLVYDAVTSTLAANEEQNASATVNGLVVSNKTNIFTDVIPGVTFTAIATHTDAANPLRVSVTADTASVKTKITSFVNAYNAVISEFQTQFKYDANTNTLGTLASETALHSAQSRLNNTILGIYDFGTNAYQTLSDLGITMADTKLLTTNTSKLDAALSSNMAGVETLFQGTSTQDAIAEKTYDYLYIMTNEADGIFTRKNQIYQNTVQDLIDLINVRKVRIDKFEEELRERFAYMEEVLSNLKAQEAAILAAKTTLESYSNRSK